MAVKLGFAPGTHLHFPLEYQWVSFNRAPNAATAWRSGGPEFGRSPEGACLARMPGGFTGGGWRAARGRRRPGMTGSGRDPPGLRNEPNCRKQKLHQIVKTDRADRKGRGSPDNAGEWRS